MPDIIQPAFSSGELTPRMFARVDFAKYHTGAALLENFYVDYRGGVNNREGSQLVSESLAQNNTPVRLIPYIVDVHTNYVLEFTQSNIRIFQAGQAVSPFVGLVASITNAQPPVVTFTAAHGLVTGDYVRFVGVGGMTDLNNQVWFFANVINATQIQLFLNSTGAVNGTVMPAFTSGGQVFKVLRLTTPYTPGDVIAFKYDQTGQVGDLGNVMTITVSSSAPHLLRRINHTTWTLTPATIGSSIGPPSGVFVSQQPPTAPAGNAYYAATSVDASGGESISSWAATGPAGITVDFSQSIVQVQWNPVAGAAYYNIYAQKAPAALPDATYGVFGFIGSSTGTFFDDTGIIPDASFTPVLADINPFVFNGFPNCCAYFQQRHVFAGFGFNPQGIEFTKIKDYFNFNYSLPIKDDDAISIVLVSNQVNIVQHLLSMPNGLIALTEYGAWQISGSGTINAPITPTSIVATAQSYVGISPNLAPIVINYDIVYVSARGNTVRDLAYNFYTQIYTGTDISILSSHLLEGLTIVDWCYADTPNKLIWMTRNDGVAITSAFMKEQEINGWSHHKTYGRYRACCSVVEGDQDVIYLAVARPTPGPFGETVFIERIMNRALKVFQDCSTNFTSNTPITQYYAPQFANQTVRAFVNTPVAVTQFYDILADVNGYVTFPVPVLNGWLGYSYISNLQSLRLDLGDPTQQGKRKNITSMTVRFYRTDGAELGPDFDDLQPWNPDVLKTGGTFESFGLIQEFTGDYYVNMGGGWQTEGQIVIQQKMSKACTVLGIIPDIVPGDTVR
jgi:hypothetical protein